MSEQGTLTSLGNSINEYFEEKSKDNPRIREGLIKGKKLVTEEDDISLVVKRAEEFKSNSNFGLFKFNDKLASTCPGFVGEVCQWITENAYRPQPALSLGAALTMMGVVKGHRVRSETNIRTNFYGLGIAGSGDGKEFPMEAVRKLMRYGGHERILGRGDPASGQAFPGMLEEGEGRCLILWDEFGHELKRLSAKNSAGHEKKIFSELLKLYSASTSIYHSNFRADRKANPGITIESPCMGVWAVSQPETFFEAIGSNNANDGFLPRFLVFNVNDPFARNRSAKGVDEPPQRFVKEMLRYLEMPTNISREGEFDTTIKPRTMSMSERVRDLSYQMEDVFDEYRRIERENKTGLDVFWSRSYVHVIKTAMIVSHGWEISEEALGWAFDLVLHITEGMCETFQRNVRDSESGKMLEKVLLKITETPGITKGKLLSKLGMKKNELDPLLDTLIERGDVKATIGYASLTKKAYQYYRF